MLEWTYQGSHECIGVPKCHGGEEMMTGRSQDFLRKPGPGAGTVPSSETVQFFQSFSVP